VPYRRKKLTFAISSPDEFLSTDGGGEPLSSLRSYVTTIWRYTNVYIIIIIIIATMA